MYKLFFRSLIPVHSIAPLVALGIGSTALQLGKSLFGGGGGGIDPQKYIDMLKQNITRTGGALQKQQEGIIRQNLAGGSRLQAQNVLGQQQNRNVESLFNTLSDAEIQALQLLFGAQAQNQRLQAVKDQQLLGLLGNLGGSLGSLLGGGASSTGK